MDKTSESSKLKKPKQTNKQTDRGPGADEAPVRCRDFSEGRVIPVTLKLAFQWLPCQAPDVIESALELVGPVSVYCDWVR